MEKDRASPRGFGARFVGNLPPVVLASLAVTVLIFMSNDGCGDRPQDFVATGITVGLGVVTALGASLLVKSRDATDRLRYALQIGIRFFLAYTLVGYGAAKLLDMQFAGTLSALDSRIIDLTPFQMVWAFFGYSYTYQAFVGWSQIVAGVLLCFRRTTTLGAIVLLPVIGNIVLVNYLFDICVRLNSTIYLAMTLYLLLLDAPRLWRLLITNEPVPPRSYPTLTTHPALLRAAPFLRLALIGFVLAYPFYDTHTARKTYHIGEPNAVYGAWQLDPPVPDTMAAWGARWEKLFFETTYFGAARGSDGTDFFSYELDTTRRHLALTFFRDSTLNLAGTYQRLGDDRLLLRGIHGEDSVEVSLRLLGEFFRERR